MTKAMLIWILASAIGLAAAQSSGAPPPPQQSNRTSDAPPTIVKTESPAESASGCPNNTAPKIVACSGSVFKIVELGPNDVGKLSPIATEAQIAAEGHWESTKPEHYRMSLNFTNATHYEGALAVDVTVAAPTDKIFMHRSARLAVDFQSIFVQPKECRQIAADVCIQSINVVAGQDLFFIQLSSKLPSETKYTVGIQKFRADLAFFSQSNKDSPTNGAFWTDTDGLGNNQLRPGVPAALSTVFRLREARTAFPCFDHPRLKAKYTLCMEHPESLLAVSNTPIRASVGDNKGLQRKRTCFETTPPISTYVFTFALLHEYETEQRLVDTELVVEILAPRGQTVLYRWIYDAVVEPTRFMGGSTRFRYPLKRIAFLMIDPFPYAGVENFGLITMNGRLARGPTPEVAGRVLLNHEIVHQWFGGVVTMTDWREICVQEGLTTFYEWAMSAQTIKAALGNGQNLTVNDRARRALASFHDDYAPFLRDFQTNREIIDHCYGVPPLFFKSLADAFGDQTFYRLFAEITAAFQFDNADLDAWDEALAKATNRQDLHNYIRSWFTLPGYPRLFVSRSGSSQVEIVQAFSSGVRPLFVKVLESSNAQGVADSPILIDKQTATVPLNDPHAAWFLLNPDDDGSPVRKIYNLDHYRRFVSCNSSDLDNCRKHKLADTPERRKLAGKEFCSALFEDRFPWGVDDETIFDGGEWTDFFDSYIDRGELEPDCECCLRSKEQLSSSGKQCTKVWNSKCRNLRINRQLGRGFKLEEE